MGQCVQALEAGEQLLMLHPAQGDADRCSPGAGGQRLKGFERKKVEGETWSNSPAPSSRCLQPPDQVRWLMLQSHVSMSQAGCVLLGE